MHHITTYSGEDFYPLSPHIDQINILDIAHALSLMCRANGHIKRFYSVAQHSMNCAIEAKARQHSKKVQLACLLHDASEAYISDLTRPVKRNLEGYINIEAQLQNLIYSRFLDGPLTSEEHTQIKEIDDALLIQEFKVLMEKPVFDEAPQLDGILNFELVDFQVIENQFLQLFYSFTAQKDRTLFPKGTYLSVGIDGCKGRWLAVALSDRGHEVQLFDRIDQVCEYYKHADSILLDMPIGLSEHVQDIRPDSALRKKLKGKTSSVFNTPCRQAVYEEDYRNASNLNFDIVGSKLSRQSFAITPKIREVDSFLQINPEWKNRLLESHPEYCFANLNCGEPILENKQTAEGVTKRLSVLERYYPHTQAVVQLFNSNYPALVKRLDDLLDAFAQASVGAIGLECGFHSIPDAPPWDNQGLIMQIVGANIP